MGHPVGASRLHAEAFDLAYRRELYAYGRARALDGGLWSKAPPGPAN